MTAAIYAAAGVDNRPTYLVTCVSALEAKHRNACLDDSSALVERLTAVTFDEIILNVYTAVAIAFLLARVLWIHEDNNNRPVVYSCQEEQQQRQYENEIGRRLLSDKIKLRHRASTAIRHRRHQHAPQTAAARVNPAREDAAVLSGSRFFIVLLDSSSHHGFLTVFAGAVLFYSRLTVEARP